MAGLKLQLSLVNNNHYEYLDTITLTNGYTVMAVTDSKSVELISYDVTNGLQITTAPHDIDYLYSGGSVVVLASYNKVAVSSHTKYDTDIYLSTWSPTAGFSDQVTTTVSISTSDQANTLVVSETGLVIVRYTTDNNYLQVFDALNGFSSNEITTIPDISTDESVTLIGGNDVMISAEGEIIWLAHIGSDDSLLVYRAADGTWADSVIVSEARVEAVVQNDDASLVGAVLTPDQSNTFSFYAWSSDRGWNTTLTKTINDDTSIITPSFVGKDDALYIGLWTNTTDKLRILRKTTSSGWKQVSKTGLGCSSSCVKTLHISKKGKVFVTWIVDSETYNSRVWDPSDKKWEKKRQLNITKATMKSNRTYHHVTPKGNFITTWYDHDESASDAQMYRTFVARWVPNSGWKASRLVSYSQIVDTVQDGNTVYVIGSNGGADTIHLSKLGIRQQTELNSYDQFQSYITAVSVGETLLFAYQDKNEDFIVEDYAI